MAQIGDLDRRIEIYTLTEARDGFGQGVPTDALLVTVWASVLPSVGSESQQGKRPVAVNEIQFLIRYRTGVTEKMKIKYNLVYYHITKIDENVKEGRKRYLILTAEKRY